MSTTTIISTAILGLGLGVVPGSIASASAQTLRVWGGNGSGQVSDAPQGNDFRAIAPGSATQSLAIRSDGTLVQWGGLGDPLAVPPIPPDLVAERFDSATAARTHVVAIRHDRTLAAWGRTPPDFGHLAVPEGRFAAVAAGVFHSVGLGVDGSLQAWGSNDSHQLEVPAGRFTDVAARTLYSIAIRDDGALVGWGMSPVFARWGVVADDPYPFYLQEGRFNAVAAGNMHALAIRDDGSVVGWGAAPASALNAPPRRFRKIAAGMGFSVGIDVNGTLWGWGVPLDPAAPLPFFPWTFESAGWTRYGETDFFYIPDEKFKDVAAAAFHVVALTAGGGPS